MSKISDFIRKAGSSKYSDSSGFEDSGKKTDESSPSQNPNISGQDHGKHRKRNRIGRILKLGNTSSSRQDEDGSPTSAQKRRQQVYQAQKRHRNRKGEYIAQLEAEVARLQHLDAVVNSESNALAHQNKAIKEFLAKQSIEIQVDAFNINSATPPDDELSQLGGAALSFRIDEEIGHERIFLDMLELSDTSWTSSEAASEGQRPKRPARHAPVTGDSWAALDFILALEWPCRAHVQHHAFNPTPEVSPACNLGYFHGHALTATQAVLQSALPTPPHDNVSSLPSEYIQPKPQAGIPDSWVLPHSEIDKLVELAEMLEIDEEFVTPAQAYAAVRETVPNENYLRPVLAALKKPLGNLVKCFGFGAGMDSILFWEHLDATIQSLEITSGQV